MKFANDDSFFPQRIVMVVITTKKAIRNIKHITRYNYISVILLLNLQPERAMLEVQPRFFPETESEGWM